MVSERKFCVYASLIPYACILMDYGRLLSQTFFSHFYNSITNPTRKPTLTLNAARCFFTKLAGGELLKQSVCVLMFPRRMLFCRRSPRCNSVRDYLLSVFLLPKKKRANLHLKWHIVGLGTKRGQMKRRGILEYRKTRAVFYLFVLNVRSVLSNQLYPSRWWIEQGCWNDCRSVFFFTFTSKLMWLPLSVRLWAAHVATAWHLLCNFTPLRETAHLFWWPRDLSPSITTSPNFITVLLSALWPSVYCENNIYSIHLQYHSTIYPVALPTWKKPLEPYMVLTLASSVCVFCVAWVKLNPWILFFSVVLWAQTNAF